MRHTEFGFEWSVCCFGYLVGSLIYPIEHSLLPDCVAAANFMGLGPMLAIGFN
jgi:hypothetical protein